MEKSVTAREKLAYIALNTLPVTDRQRIARYCTDISRQVPDLDLTDALLLLHMIGRYMNIKGGLIERG